MPFEDTFDLDLESDTSNLDKLDRMAAKAAVSLEKKRKALEAASQKLNEGTGAFRGPNLPAVGGAPQDLRPLSKQDQKIQKKLGKLEEKVRKDTVKQFGDKKGFLSDILGPKSAKNIFSIGRNPLGFLTGAMKSLPILGGILAAKEIAEFVIKELVKLDAFFKAFIDAIDERTSKHRDLVTQARIQAGLQQDIVTTAYGTVDAKESFNTFNIFETNQIEVEEKYALQNTSGGP